MAFLCFIVMCTSMSISELSAAVKKSGEKHSCEKLPLVVLQRLHGAAYDARYMSISRPINIDIEDIKLKFADPNDRDQYLIKRNTEESTSFDVSADHTYVISDEPAWDVQWDKLSEMQPENQNARRKKRDLLAIGVEPLTAKVNYSGLLDEEEILQRQKRQNSQSGQHEEPWRCETRIKWIDLGPDFHPSHLRTTECTKSDCWYQIYKCQPKHFALHILRRRRGTCSNANKLKMYGFVGELAEVWEWVEVAVNFCCECVRKSDSAIKRIIA